MKYLCVADVAMRSGLSVSFLNKLRTQGGGPPFAKIGAKAVRYPEDKVLDWLASCERRSTSENSQPAKLDPSDRSIPPPNLPKPGDARVARRGQR
jgi:predicted DNA-binding transcriptional regulator AlpA